MTYEFDPDWIKMNRLAEYLSKQGQRSFHAKVTVAISGPTSLPAVVGKFVIIKYYVVEKPI